MSTDRRTFLGLLSAGATGCLVPGQREPHAAASIPASPPDGPVLLSTWDHGRSANERGNAVLGAEGSILDAVVEGVAVVESDLSNRSVGLGGWPDRDGFTTLDACVQDHDGKAGSVAFVQRFENPIRIARAVMERTPHVMLVGSGAERWARENGFTERQVEIPEVRARWREWLQEGGYTPLVNTENQGARKPVPQGGSEDHDTIGMLGIDGRGRLAGSCTTSGMAWKVHGRVGDSPIIGAGLFVDGEVGAACATGTGELVIRVAGSHAVVELMRQGIQPQEACRQVVERILRKHPGLTGHQVGFLALRRDGATGACAIYNGFTYAITRKGVTDVLEAPSVMRWE